MQKCARLDGNSLQLLTQQLPRGGLPTNAPTHSFHLTLCHLFGKEDEKSKKGYIATYIKYDSQDVLSTTSTSVVRSSTTSENFLMLAIANAVHGT